MNNIAKLMILISLLTIILLAGCSSKDQYISSNNDEATVRGDVQAAPSGEVDDGQMELVTKCDFLTAKDIKEVCGSDVETVDFSDLYGPCAVSFTNDAGRELKQIYYGYTASDNKEMMYNYCITSTGKELEDSICVDPSEYNIYIYGDHYSISLGGDLHLDEKSVCSFEEMQELARILKNKIYG